LKCNLKLKVYERGDSRQFDEPSFVININNGAVNIKHRIYILKQNPENEEMVLPVFMGGYSVIKGAHDLPDLHTLRVNLVGFTFGSVDEATRQFYDQCVENIRVRCPHLTYFTFKVRNIPYYHLRDEMDVDGYNSSDEERSDAEDPNDPYS
jgi:hypothetical protein